MPAKHSRTKAPDSPSEEQLGVFVKDLCRYLSKGKNKKGEIKTTNIVRRIEEILRAYRKKSRMVSDNIMLDLVAAMESGGEDYCSQMDPAVFSVVLDTLLQADTYMEAQRGICLLATSLHRDSNGQEMEASIEQRKGLIGKESLHRLFMYFTDGSLDFLMRRWIGILCIELIRCSDGNLEQAAYCPEETRRGIGRLVLKEPDDIIRFIAAKLTRTLNLEGMDLEDIWPEDHLKYYKGFPMSSTSGARWAELFLRWLENVYEINPEIKPEQIGDVFYVRAVRLIPETIFGVLDNMVIIYMDNGTMSILAPTNDNSLDQLLDISLSSLLSASVVADNSSQLQEVQINLGLDPDPSRKKFLDAATIKLDMINVYIEIYAGEQLLWALKRHCPDLEIIAVSEKSQSDLDDQSSSMVRNAWSAIPIHNEVVDSPLTGYSVRCEVRAVTGVEEVDPQQEQPIVLQHEARTCSKDHSISFHDPLTAWNPVSTNIKTNGNQVRSNQAQQISKAKSRNKVRPKAKPPIFRNGQRKVGKPQPREHDAGVASISAIKTHTDSFDNGASLKSVPLTEAHKEEESSRKFGAAQHSASAKVTSAMNRTATELQPNHKSTNDESKREVHYLCVNGLLDTNTDDATMTPNPLLSKSPSNATSEVQNLLQGQDRTPSLLQKKRSQFRKSSGAGVTKAADTNEFEIPDDPEGKIAKLDIKTPKIRLDKYSNPKTARSSGKIAKKARYKVKGPSKGKQRQSAPVILDNVDVTGLPIRASKRAAAAKAKMTIHNIDGSNNFEKTINIHTQPRTISNLESVKEIDRTKNVVHGSAIAVSAVPGGPVLELEFNERTTNFAPATEMDRMGFPKENEATHQIRSSNDKEIAGVNEKDPDNAKSDQVMIGINVSTKDDAREFNSSHQKSSSFNLKDGNHVGNMTELELAPGVESLTKKDLSVTLPTTESKSSKTFAERLSAVLRRIPNIEDESFKVENLTPLLPGISSNVNYLTKETPVKAIMVASTGNSKAYSLKKLVGSITQDHVHVEQSGHETCKALQKYCNSTTVSSALEELASEPISRHKTEKLALHHGKETMFQMFPLVSKRPKNMAKPMQQPCVSKEKGERASQEPENPIKLRIQEISYGNEITGLSPEMVISEDVKGPISGAVEHSNMNFGKYESYEDKLNGTKEKHLLVDDYSLPEERRHKEVDRNRIVNQTGLPQNLVTQPKKELVGSLALPKYARMVAQSVAGPPAQEYDAKDLGYKPNIVAFWGGSLEQGQSSNLTTKKPARKVSAVPQLRDVAEHNRKRTLESTCVVRLQRPPKKRQHSSPTELVDRFDCDEELHKKNNFEYEAVNQYHQEKIDHIPTVLSNLAIPVDKHVRLRLNRQSSLSSRVDKNGSPVAAQGLTLDHIGKLKERLSKCQYPESFHDHHSDSAEESPQQGKPVVATMFEPPVDVHSNLNSTFLKYREMTSRYIAHEKTSSGHYKDIQSEEVVASEAVFADPFKLPSEAKSTRFLETLLGTSNDQTQHCLPINSNSQSKELEALPGENEIRKHCSEPNCKDRIEVNVHKDTKNPLAEPICQYGLHIPLDDMTKDHLPGARSTIKPHYNNAREAIHRIADEVIIRLSNEEDRMKLVAKQFDENGTLIIDKLIVNREKEKNMICQELVTKSTKMKIVYADAKDHIHERMQELKETLNNDIDEEWKLEQDKIQKLINVGVASRK